MSIQPVIGAPEDWEVTKYPRNWEGRAFHVDGEEVLYDCFIEKCLLPSVKQRKLIIPNRIGDLDIQGVGSRVFCKNTYEMVGFEDAEEVFVENEDIVELIVSEGITALGREAFETCTKLETVILPETIKILEDGCFRYCMKLSNINFPSSLETIGYDCFNGCNSLSTVSVPSSIKKMDHAFAFTEIDTVILSEGITSIDNFAFSMAKINSMVLPRSLTRIGTHMAIPEPSTGITLFCYPGTYGLIYARQHGYKVESAAI